MDYIRVTADNLEAEHICCAISNNNDVQVASKKQWLKERFDDGLVFLKSSERGKCFIEYLPAENAWVPLEADGFMYIDCLWVSGSMKGHGYSNDLLGACIEDSREKKKKGVCLLSSSKKRPFLADPRYLQYKGFVTADESDAGINLMCLTFDEKTELPRFKDSARHPCVSDSGFLLYYTNQCPFNAKYVPIVETAAHENGIPFRSIRITSASQAQCAPTPCTTYSLFYNGKFVTNEQMSDKKFLKLASEM